MHPVQLADYMRQIAKGLTLKTTPEEPAEHRYEEAGGEWKLRTWRDGRETVAVGQMHTRPSWLLSIVNVGLMGGHAKRVPEPPPNLIMWFRTNPDNSLHSYIDFQK
jgi:hypothetical protein